GASSAKPVWVSARRERPLDRPPGLEEQGRRAGYLEIPRASQAHAAPKESAWILTPRPPRGQAPDRQSLERTALVAAPCLPAAAEPAGDPRLASAVHSNPRYQSPLEAKRSLGKRYQSR